MVSARSRIGIACTEWKPTRSAAGANCGHLSRSRWRSGTLTGAPVRTDSRQGPSSFCSWNSSSSRDSSLEDATGCRVPRGSTSSSPAAVTSSRSTQEATRNSIRSTTS